jgi:hypothetical protein
MRWSIALTTVAGLAFIKAASSAPDAGDGRRTAAAISF